VRKPVSERVKGKTNPIERGFRIIHLMGYKMSIPREGGYYIPKSKIKGKKRKANQKRKWSWVLTGDITSGGKCTMATARAGGNRKKPKQMKIGKKKDKGNY